MDALLSTLFGEDITNDHHKFYAVLNLTYPYQLVWPCLPDQDLLDRLQGYLSSSAVVG